MAFALTVYKNFTLICIRKIDRGKQDIKSSPIFCPSSWVQELGQPITVPIGDQQLEDIHQVMGGQNGEQALTP